MIINLGSDGMTMLSKLINIIWKTGQLSGDWKTAVLIPLLKKNKAKSDHQAKKPISLTSYIGTLVERIICRKSELVARTQQYHHTMPGWLQK